jgi:hypothetical protein
VRQGAAGKLHLAYLGDPDGNKLCGPLPHAALIQRNQTHGPSLPTALRGGISLLVGIGAPRRIRRFLENQRGVFALKIAATKVPTITNA